MKDLLLKRVINRLKKLLYIEWFYSNKYLLIYTIGRQRMVEQLSDSPPKTVNRNHFPDLECFEQTESWLSKSEFLSEARARIDKGMWFYTIVIDGVLAHYCWVFPNQESSWLTFVEQRYYYPDNSVIMFNAYTHPNYRGKGLYYEALVKKMYDAVNALDASHIFTAVENKTIATKKNLKRANFRCNVVLFRKSRFGRVRRGKIEDGFDAFM